MMEVGFVTGGVWSKRGRYESGRSVVNGRRLQTVRCVAALDRESFPILNQVSKEG